MTCYQFLAAAVSIMTTRKSLKRPLEDEERLENGGRQEFANAILLRNRGKSKKPCLSHPLTSALTEPAPFTCNLPSPAKRKKPITYEEASKGTAEPVRVYADGVFDIFHPGHARVLMQAKQAFPNTHLIAGVTSDELTHQLKGKTVCDEAERYDALRHCRYVDEVLTDAPWVITPEFMEMHQIDFVAHDDIPYSSGDTEDIYKDIKDMGRFVPMQRTPGISTSDVIARIVKDYDMYLKRNLARGYTARDMNLGFIKAKEVKIREKMSNLKHGVEERGKDLIGGFMSLFGRDGTISEFFHGPKAIFQRVFSGSPPGSPSPEEEETSMAGQEWQTAQGEVGNSSTGSSPQSPLPQIPELEDITS